MEKWFKIQEPGDLRPFAVVYLGDDNLVRRYVPGEGLVDWPAMGMWIFGDEMGCTEISRADAVRLMRAGVGRLSPGLDTSDQRGAAPPLSPPSGV